MLQVSVPIAHELLGQCIKQGEALVQRASLVGDFSDYESWKSARKQWIDPTVQALEHVYGGPKEAGEFAEAATCPESVQRWQEEYSADLRCVEEAIDLLEVLQGELAFVGPGGGVPPAAELTQGEQTGIAAPEDAIDLPPAAPSEREQAIPREQTAPGSLPSESARTGERPFAELPPKERVQERPVGSELAMAQQPGSELAPQEAPGAPAEQAEPGAPGAAPTRARQVLLAHGRDEGWKQAVEHLLEHAGEHEIRIVKRRAERGRLTEVLGEEPHARYAIVLLTADDVGGPRLESDAEPFFSTRAHQEVV